MRRTRLFSMLGAVLLAACTVVFVGDLEVSWSVDGVSSGSAVCADFGIDKWEVSISGPIRDSYEFKCGDHWNSGDFFYNIDEGRYTVTINALDVDGTVLATASSKEDFFDDGGLVWKVSFALTASDFEANAVNTTNTTNTIADASAIISWKINGTTDGEEDGPSWDNCDEVGAVSIAITLDGESLEYDCKGDANDQSVTIKDLTAGKHDVSLVLLDTDGKEITTPAEGAIEASATPVAEVFDFPFDSFVTELKESITGDFLFILLFENGLTCEATNPAVSGMYTLLKLDGTPVTASVCDPASSCVATDGAAKGFCSKETQSIADLLWGAYKLRVKGSPTASTDVCWETYDQAADSPEINILVGAGTENPVVDVMLDRVDDENGACVPN